MDTKQYIKIEKQILSKRFYMHHFRNEFEASEYFNKGLPGVNEKL